MQRKIAVIIPFFNEEKVLLESLQNLVQEILLLESNHRVSFAFTLIDDGSTDSSLSIARQFIDQHPTRQITLLESKKNLGKGNAIKYALREIKLQQQNFDWIILTDADLEYHSQNLISFTKLILANEHDFIVGNRFDSNAKNSYYLTHFYANKLISFLCSKALRRPISDVECGLKAIRKTHLDQITLSEDGFGIEVEIIFELLTHAQVAYAELPVHYVGRGYQDGKKINFSDGLEALYLIIKYRYLKRRQSVPETI